MKKLSHTQIGEKFIIHCIIVCDNKEEKETDGQTELKNNKKNIRTRRETTKVHGCKTTKARELHQLLCGYGFYPGNTVEIIARSGKDLVVRICNTEIAMSAEVAEQIGVQKRQERTEHLQSF